MKVKLPKVYSDSYQLTLTAFARSKSFPKPMRPNLGRRIEEASLDLTSATRKMLLCPKSENARKAAYLLAAEEAVDELKFLCQLAGDLKAMSAGSYGGISEQLEAIGKQIGGLRSQKRDA